MQHWTQDQIDLSREIYELLGEKLDLTKYFFFAVEGGGVLQKCDCCETGITPYMISYPYVDNQGEGMWIDERPIHPLYTVEDLIEILKCYLGKSNNQIQLTYDVRTGRWFHLGIGSTVLLNLSESSIKTALLRLTVEVLRKEKG